MAGVQIQNATLGYDDVPAVNALSTEIMRGSLTAVVGPNGAGKSTLLRGISGELKPLAGAITRDAPAQCDIAYLPQASSIDRSFPISVRDFVAMGFWHQVGAFGQINKYHKAQLSEAVHAVGLQGLEDRSIGALSGGQMQRVLFARLLLQDAKLVLLDEPFTAIDTKTTADLLDIVHGWHNAGKTVIAVLHDYDLVKAHFPETLMIARDMVDHGPTGRVITAQNILNARQMCEACDSPPGMCDHRAVAAE